MTRKIGEVLWLALQCAKDDRQSLVDAYKGDESEWAVKKAMADIKAFEALQLKLFGATQTELNAKIAAMKPIDIFKLLAMPLDEREKYLKIDD